MPYYVFWCFGKEYAKMKEVSVSHLSLSIKGKRILDDITFTMQSGKIYGLVGRNGSGKTMLLKCACGYLKPSSGEILIDGMRFDNNESIKQKIGIIIENPGFLEEYTAYYNLKILSTIGKKLTKNEIYAVMEQVGLKDAEKKKVKKYSLGMKQRLAFAQAIMEGQDFLVLDEPTNGIDKDGLEMMHSVLLDMKARGKIILLASHNTEDTKLLCDKIYKIEDGKFCSLSLRK